MNYTGAKNNAAAIVAEGLQSHHTPPHEDVSSREISPGAMLNVIGYLFIYFYVMGFFSLSSQQGNVSGTATNSPGARAQPFLPLGAHTLSHSP